MMGRGFGPEISLILEDGPSQSSKQPDTTKTRPDAIRIDLKIINILDINGAWIDSSVRNLMFCNPIDLQLN